MNKSKEKQFNFLSKRQNRYAIRRFSAGIASVLVGTALFFGVHTSEASAAEQDQTSEAKQTPSDVSDVADTLTETNEKAAQVPTTAPHPSNEEVKQKATDSNVPLEQSAQIVEQSNEAQPTEIPTNDAASTPEAPVKEQPNDAQATDESNNVTPKNDTEQQANNETSTRNTKTTDETKTETSIKEKVTEENATEKTPQEDTPHSEAVPKNETDTIEKQATESSTSETSTTETSTTDTPTQKQESPSLENPTDQTQMKTTQPQTTETPKLTEEELEDLLTETSFESMNATTRALYLGLLKDYTNKQDALKPAATVKTKNQSDKVTAPKTKTWPSDVVPESKVEIPADAIANGYVGSATDATNAAHTLSGRAWVLGHGTPATMANGLKPVPEGTKVHLQWIDTDGATSPIYTAKTTDKLSSVDGSQVGPGAYVFDLRQGWTDANGKHHLYSATKGQRYKLWIDDFRTKDGNINTMLRVSGGFIPGTFADSVTHNNMGQFPLIGTNMQRTGIFMTTIPGEEYLTAKHVVNDSKGATANPAVTMIEDDYVSGRLWVETGYGDYSNSATGPNFNSKDKAAAGYKVVMTSLTDTGAKAYDAHVNHLPEKDRAAAAHKLLTAHPEYMSVTVVGTTNERGEYTLRFPKGTLNKDHLYGYVLNPDGDIVTSYSGFTSPEFRRPNYDLATAPQTAPYYRPIRNAWANVNFAVTEATHAQINIKNFDATSNPGHRGQAAYVDITGMPHTSLTTRVQWKDTTGKVVQDSGPVSSEAEAERKGQFTIPTDAKSGDVYTVELVVGDSVTASDSLIVHVNEDAAKYQPVYPAVTIEPGQSATIPAPKNADGKALPNGTTFEKGHHVPTWVTVNDDGSITVKPGKHVTEDDYGIPVIVTYPDGSRNTVFAPVTVQEKEPMASEYEPTTEGVTKPFGTPVTSADVTGSVKIPNFPVEGQQPTATVDDESQLPNGTVEGQVDVGVTVTYPDGTTDHITVPVVTQNQPDGDKYEPTTGGVTKPFGEPVTSTDVTDSIHIPNFPVEGQQPTATVDDESQLPDGTVEGQVDVGVTVTYPDGTTDHITVPVVTQNQPDGDKYEPTSEGVTKPFGEPVTSTDVTDSIHIPNFPVEGQQPTATVDDETQLPDGTVEGRVDVGVTVTYPDGTTDHITVPVVTNKQPDGDKYEPTSEGVTKPFGTPVTSTDVTDSVKIPNFPVEGQQPTATVDDETQLPDGTVEGRVDVGVTVTYPDGTTDHITVPVVTQNQPDGDKYEPTSEGVTKPFGTPVTSDDVTDSVKIPNFPGEGQQPTATVDDETQLPDGTVEGRVDVGVTVTYPDGTTDHITVPVVTQNQPDGDKYDPTTTGVTKPFGTPVTSTDVTDSIRIPNFPVEGQQPTATVDDESQLPDGTVEGQVDVGVTVTYPDGTTDHITVPVVTNKQPDNEKYDPVTTGILKQFGDPTTAEDVTKLVEVPYYPEDKEQPKVTVTDPTTLPDGQTPGKADVDVTVTYPDGTTDHIQVPVWTNNQLDKDKYEPTSEGVTKKYGDPVTSKDVTDSVKIPNFPVEGQQPTATVDDETQLPDGTVEGRVDVGVTVTYPDGTTDHITVPVVTQKQPDNEKYEPTTTGITKVYGTPTTAAEVTGSVRIPHFPVDGKQPVVTVNDPRQLPNGKKEGQINVPVTVTYPDGTKDHMTVPVITGKQADNEKYDPITLGVVKNYGDPTTAADVTDSIQIPTYPVGGQQPVATVDDETKLPDGTTEGEVDIPVTVTYPDGTQDHITVPVFTNQQRDNQKYEPTSEGVTKDYGIPTGVDDVLNTVTVPDYPADREEQPVKTVDAPDRLPDGTTEGQVLVGVTVTYPDGSKDHIKVPVVTNPPTDNVRYEPTTDGITKPFGQPTTADDVTGAVKIPNFPTEGDQPIVTVINPKQLPNGKKEGQTNVGVTVTYPDGTTDYFTVPVVTTQQSDSDKYTPTTEGITKPFGVPTNADEVEDAVHIPGYPTDAEPPVVTVKDVMQLPDGSVGATVDVDVRVTYPDGTTDEISVPVTTGSSDDEGGHGSSGSSAGGSAPGSNGPTVRPSIKLTGLKGFVSHFAGPTVNHQQADSDKYSQTSEGVTKAHGVPVTTTDTTDSVHDHDGSTTELTVPVKVGSAPTIHLETADSNGVKSTLTTVDAVDTQTENVSTTKNDIPTADDVPTVAQGHETDASTTKTQQPVRDKVITMPTVAHDSKQANHDEKASNQTNDTPEKVTLVTTTAASVANGNVVPTHLATAPHAQVTQPVGTSAESTAKEEVKQLPETGENKKQAGALLGGLIAVIGGLLLFGRRRNEKKD
ncbi:Rib/alpha-like domain-containing protein [Staphylococcus delphini]|uniref:Rib/alpha-like domain-containing protein n=1 Tax=Staphylococcus delphini TaxID=53344 RepID=UPI000BBBB77C|nr:Rib/alpha-like domain-containing protein [Staphylococcus delphini]PCF49369.1 hypothetical protein B5C09_03225 [Staphylococcus delphini]